MTVDEIPLSTLSVIARVAIAREVEGIVRERAQIKVNYALAGMSPGVNNGLLARNLLVSGERVPWDLELRLQGIFPLYDSTVAFLQALRVDPDTIDEITGTIFVGPPGGR